MTDADEVDPAVVRAITAVVRDEHGAVVGGLMRRFGDVDLAEESAADALETAWRRWPRDGIPPNAGGWLTTTATRRALDRLRRESIRGAREQEATMTNDEPALPLGVVDDDRLRLLFLCCHPALAPESQVALTLRLVCGLSMPEIAAAFLVPERTMAQRLTRTKRKIRDARIPFVIPRREDLPERIAGVLATLYLAFNESYLSVGDPSGTRPELADEAIRLTRQLVGLVPAEPEAQGLLALMLITRSRDAARVVDGRLVPFEEQDRSRWDAALLAEGRTMIRALLGLGRPGRYQVQAAIAAAHTDRPVRWDEVVALHDLLLTFSPTPVVRLSRALALARTDAGPEAALAEIDALPLADYHPWHVGRAHLLERLGRRDEARAALEHALALHPTPLEAAHLHHRLLRPSRRTPVPVCRGSSATTGT